MRWIQDAAYRLQAESAYTRVSHLSEQIMRYYTDQISVGGQTTISLSAMPATYQDLIDNGYVGKCLNAQYDAGKCIRFDRLPFGEADIRRRMLIREVLMRLPSYEEDAATEIATFTIERPSAAWTFDAFVAVDGQTQMTQDWDYGGQNLVNVKNLLVEDIAFGDYPGITAQSGMIYSMGSVKHGGTILSQTARMATSRWYCLGWGSWWIRLIVISRFDI